MRNIEKDYIDSLEVIGVGTSGKVYHEKDSDKAIKLFYDRFGAKEIEKVYDISLVASNSVNCVPKMYELISCDNCYGYIFEAIIGSPLPKYIGKDTEKRYAAGTKMGETLREFHNIKPDENVFPTIGQMARRNIFEPLKQFFDEEEIESYVQFVDNLPGKKVVLHGDYHENNIIVNEKGEYKVIDIDSISIGSFVLDLAQSYCTYKTPLDDFLRQFLGLNEEIVQNFLYKMLSAYFDTTDMDLIKKYDEALTEFANYNRCFGYPIVNAKEDPALIKKYMDEHRQERDSIRESLKKYYDLFSA